MRVAVVDDQSSRVRFHGKGFAERILRTLRAETQSGYAPPCAFSKLQSGFKRVLAEYVRNEVGRSAGGFFLTRIDAEVARRNLRIEYLF
jgi:hypothetical protein